MTRNLTRFSIWGPGIQWRPPVSGSGEPVKPDGGDVAFMPWGRSLKTCWCWR
jgi:hypothetical protein